MGVFFAILSTAMKLKKAESPAAEAELPSDPVVGGAVIADRFKLDVVEDDGKQAGPGRAMLIAGVVVALLALAAAGTVVALMYQNWQLIEHV